MSPPPSLPLHIPLLNATEEPEVVMCSPVTVYLGVVYWICCLRDVTDEGLIDGGGKQISGESDGFSRRSSGCESKRNNGKVINLKRRLGSRVHVEDFIFR